MDEPGSEECRAQASGIDLVRRIRSETSLAPSRVILISTHADEDLADLITAAPVAAFLSKSRLSVRAIRDILGVDAS